MRAVIALMLSLTIICPTLMSACRSNGGNVKDPDNGSVDTPGNDELGFDPFSDEIYGVYLSDMDWEPNSLAGWVNDDFPQEHLI